jgi:hypothetical protein
MEAGGMTRLMYAPEYDVAVHKTAKVRRRFVDRARGELVEKELDAMIERGAHRGEALLR